MHSVTRATVIGLGCLLITLTLSVPALAQGSFVTSYQTTDFSGEWTEMGMSRPLLKLGGGSVEILRDVRH